MPWIQVYAPIRGSIGLSAAVAALPLAVVFVCLAILRIKAFKAVLLALAAAVALSVLAWGMPAKLAGLAMLHGAAFGLFPVYFIVLSTLFLYNITVKGGQFDVIRASLASVTSDRRLQALLIAFCFGAFIEGAAGFGTPVAIAGATLAGLGFRPFYAAGICLLANTAPVAFGAIAIPVITLAGITGLPLADLSADVGRICAPVSLCVPAYLILVMGGWKALRGVLPGAIVCGGFFAGTQFAVSNFVGPYLTDILSSLAALGALVVLLHIWKPSDSHEGHGPSIIPPKHPAGEVILAWMPYILLVVLGSLWGLEDVKKLLNLATHTFPWPGLHNQILRVAPAVGKASPYGAI